MSGPKPPEGAIRQAEVLAALSLALDLGLGTPTEWMQKTALVAARLARAAGLPVTRQRSAFYLALIRQVGCTGTARDDARDFGNELGLAPLLTADPDDGRQMMRLLGRLLGAGQPLPQRLAVYARFAAAMARGKLEDNNRNHCEAGAILAERLGLGPEVGAALWHHQARWDGRGLPKGLAGEAVDPAARVMHVATLAAHFDSEGGTALACDVVQSRAGRQLDPALCRIFITSAGDILRPSDQPMMAALLDAEPGEPSWLAGPALDLALQAIADFTDQKSPPCLGHSRRVAGLATETGRLCGLRAPDLDLLHRAGHIHDVGRVGVSAGVLCKVGPLTPAEWERVRLHPYLTERVFSASPMLRPAAALGAMHHECLDGSGYYRGLTAADMPATARILATANAYAALTEDRPHRPAQSPEAAAKALSAAAQAGKHDRRVLDAVLAAAGAAPARPRRGAAITLSERELEVLRLVARQNSNKAIARTLGISGKTVEHHISHIFDKTGVTSRTGAALYASHNQLL